MEPMKIENQDGSWSVVIFSSAIKKWLTMAVWDTEQKAKQDLLKWMGYSLENTKFTKKDGYWIGPEILLPDGSTFLAASDISEEQARRILKKRMVNDALGGA
ncbi:MAG: hypothetical protein LC660_08670 [Desulfobacteraceae bacterium]|nr:hypothetical protein [Desulfobacteraceae bacterium]